MNLDEPILPPEYPMHGGYLYVVDGVVRMCEWMRHPVHDRPMTVLEYCQREGVSEVRRCDIYGRKEARTHNPLFDGDGLGDAARITEATPKRSKSKKRSYRIRKTA